MEIRQFLAKTHWGDWWTFVRRIADAVSHNNLLLIAAGTAFYAFLSIPAVLTALVSLYGLAFDPAGVQRHLQAMAGVLPGQSIAIIGDQLNKLATGPQDKLGIGLLISLMIAFWSAKSATSSMVTALNIAYGEEEKRGFLKFQFVRIIRTRTDETHFTPKDVDQLRNLIDGIFADKPSDPGHPGVIFQFIAVFFVLSK